MVGRGFRFRMKPGIFVNVRMSLAIGIGTSTSVVACITTRQAVNLKREAPTRRHPSIEAARLPPGIKGARHAGTHAAAQARNEVAWHVGPRKQAGSRRASSQPARHAGSRRQASKCAHTQAGIQTRRQAVARQAARSRLQFHWDSVENVDFKTARLFGILAKTCNLYQCI